jgi:hypothetical protein
MVKKSWHAAAPDQPVLVPALSRARTPRSSRRESALAALREDQTLAYGTTPQQAYLTYRQNLSRPPRMKFVVRPESPTAGAGPSQAPAVAVDDSAPVSTRPEPILNRGKLLKQP